MSTSIEAVEAFLEGTAEERLEELKAFVRIPTIGVLSDHDSDMGRGAEWIAARMRGIGLEHVEVSPTAGHPVVYADWLHADGAPTVLVYAHYDVQPADPLGRWVRPPFEPRVENGRIYGRGVADDKGQLHLHLWAARAWLETQGRLPLNVRYVFEGEEEAGSPNFEAWLEANTERLGADVVVVTDTGFYEGNHPALTVSLRGNMYLQLDVIGPRQDLHSGGFGGMVQNPANALIRILSTLRDGEGRVTVPGFYDEAPDLSDAERREFARVRPSTRPTSPRASACLSSSANPVSARSSARACDPRWMSAACGPASRERGARPSSPRTPTPRSPVDWRRACSQTTTFQRVRDAIRAVDVPGVRVEITQLDSMWPFVVSPDHPAAQTAVDCLREVFGAEPLLRAPGWLHRGRGQLRQGAGAPLRAAGLHQS